MYRRHVISEFPTSFAHTNCTTSARGKRKVGGGAEMHSGLALGVWKAKCCSCGRCVCRVPPYWIKASQKECLFPDYFTQEMQKKLCFHPCWRVKGFTAFTPLRFYYETTPLKVIFWKKRSGTRISRADYIGSSSSLRHVDPCLTSPTARQRTPLPMHTL